MTLVVIGGGLAGAAAATLLARAGRKVVLLERTAGPHDKVCGAFLSAEAQRYLADLGLDLAGLGAVPLDRLRLGGPGGRAELRLPFQGTSLSRAVLDEALLDLASEAGAELRRGVRAVALNRVTAGWQVRLDTGTPIEAAAVFLATGKHDLRNWRRPPGRQDDLVGFQQHFRLAQRPDRLVELALFPGGYAGLQPVEDGRVNLCLVVRHRRLAEPRGWDGVWSDLLAALPALAGAEPLGRRQAVAWIPYGHVQRRSDGVWRLGDQAAVMPSFTGDGMSITLHSAVLAAGHYLAGTNAAIFQRRLARDVAGRIGLATVLSHALVRPTGQAMLLRLARLLPGLGIGVARATRVPERALMRARRAVWICP